MPPVFTVGWVCALPVELAAAEEIMDEEYDPLPYPPTDTNLYTFGRVGAHNVVAACLPAGKTGNNSAAVVASQMRNSFPALRFGLLVGIGGGVPSQEHDIRLGDVVISQPAAQYGGVVQFDFGKTELGGGFTRTGSLDAPPTILLNALAKLRANILRGKLRIMEHLSAFVGLETFACPGSKKDVLYSASSQHVPGSTCASCKMEDIVVRQARTTLEPVLFFGTIASGNQVMKDALTRDHISQKLGGVLCFEMEAAGLMDYFGCLVVRGICDYADAHKNKQWQPYAAATAAACAKELLTLVPQVVSATGDSQMAHPTSAVRSTASSLSDEDKECLQSLAFPEQESRGQEIHFAKNTCQWLLNDSQYREWTKKTRGLFWVKGSPGTGKSALMKYAATTMRYKQPGDLVIAYFIHGRGTDLQRSPLGVFRALLNTMLESFSENLSQLTETYKDRETRCGPYHEKKWKWEAQELQDCMLKTLSKGTKDKSVIIFIDALDECGEYDAKDLLSYFRDLMQQVEVESGKVKICFSSRHYPILGLDTIPSVSAEDRNRWDIQSVVRERLKQIKPESKRQQIERQILSNSQGVFQWAVLVTGKFIDGIATGMRETNLSKTLTSIPETLDGLYGDILSSSTGAKREQMVKLFQWILFARRPLSSQELREALATDKDMDLASVDLLRRHDSWVESLSQFEKHVRHLSRGLVEFKDRKLGERYQFDEGPSSLPTSSITSPAFREAQFIHQSVGDYLLDKFLPHEEDRTTAPSVVGAGHFEISRSCFRYITMGDVLGAACLSQGSLPIRFPLAPYAVQFLFHHIRKVEKEGIPQFDLVTLIRWNQQPKFSQQLAHLWKVVDRDSSFAPRGWSFVGATPLHVSITFGSKSALNAVLQVKNSEIGARDSHGNTPLLLAIRQCQSEMALMLLDRSFEWSHCRNGAVHGRTNQTQCIDLGGTYDAGVNAANDVGDTPLYVAASATTKVWKLIFRLLEAGADVKDFSDKIAHVIYAIRNMDMTLFIHLVQEYGPPDFVHFGLTEIFSVLQQMFSKDKYDDLESFISKLLKTGCDTGRSRTFISEILKSGGNTSRSQTFDESFRAHTIHDFDLGFLFPKDDEAISLALRRGQTSMVSHLLSHKISPNHSDINGETLLNLAAAQGSIEIAELLIAYGASPHIANKNEKTPLAIASANGELEFIELLLAKGASPNIANLNAEAPLNLALAHGHFDIAKLLLAYGASPNTANENEKTPLAIASANGQLEFIELFLAKGASPNIANRNAEAPLNLALAHGHFDIAKLLLAYGAHPDIANENGKTPLAVASANGHLDLVELLLAKGACPDIADNTGKTAFDLALAGEFKEVASLLLETGPDLDAADDEERLLLYLAWSGNPSRLLHRLLSDHVNPNTTSNGGCAALCLAAAGGHLKTARLLLKNGANPSIAGKNGCRPLHVASAGGHLHVIRLLLQKGADINTLDDDGRTPFYTAVENGHLETARLLLKKGANPNIACKQGQTPLQLALACQYTDVTGLLLEKEMAQCSLGAS